MCERYSWIEKDDAVLFLTGEQVYHTIRGKETQKHCNNDPNQYYGHGAIRFYYECQEAVDRECTDFSTPTNFPPELVEAIKTGKMGEFGVTDGMLTMLIPATRAKYQKIRDAACAKHMKIDRLAFAEYVKVRDDTFWDLFKNPKNRIECWR